MSGESPPGRVAALCSVSHSSRSMLTHPARGRRVIHADELKVSTMTSFLHTKTGADQLGFGRSQHQTLVSMFRIFIGSRSRARGSSSAPHGTRDTPHATRRDRGPGTRLGPGHGHSNIGTGIQAQAYRHMHKCTGI